MPQPKYRFAAPRNLLEMLTYRRPADSRSEGDFIDRFLDPLGFDVDPEGNLSKRIGTAPVLWSCHVDTVHSKPGRQTVRADGGIVRLAQGEQSSCLGADDAAGVWLVSEMIRAGVEGLYIVHRGEEIGGIGSTYIADETPERLDGIRMAIALDRRGQESVITHQGDRCASDTFARALGDAIGLGMRPDPTGLFTDTANYIGIIPECSNLSVGYEAAHSANETLDTAYLVTLLGRLVELDTTSLPIVRKPVPADRFRFGAVATDWSDGFDGSSDSANGDDYYRLIELIESDPDTVADILLHHGISAREIERWKL